MKKYISLFLILMVISGCAVSQKTVKPVEPEVKAQEESVVTEVQANLVEEKEAEMQPQIKEADEEVVVEDEKLGVVFAKTDFLGVLKTSYVQLIFEDMDVPDNKFKLIIGDKTAQNPFVGEARTVEPGYFFIELPPGHYQIASVSIPVGSTLATEEIDIQFDVIADKFIYIGTLQINGTKEKIRLGGVPVIKPGFEYTVKIFDQQDEGKAAFQDKYPTVKEPVVVQLMHYTPHEK